MKKRDDSFIFTVLDEGVNFERILNQFEPWDHWYEWVKESHKVFECRDNLLKSGGVIFRYALDLLGKSELLLLDERFSKIEEK